MHCCQRLHVVFCSIGAGRRCKCPHGREQLLHPAGENAADERIAGLGTLQCNNRLTGKGPVRAGNSQTNQLKAHKNSCHLTAAIWSQLGRSGFKVGVGPLLAELRIILRTCLSSLVSARFGQAPLMPSTACAKPSVQA